MKRHYIAAIVLWVLFFQFVIAVGGLHVRADLVIEVPVFDQMNTGSGLCIGSNVSMPKAYVDIDIVVEEGFCYIINVSCQFLLQTIPGQNFTTAFVYPSEWSNGPPPETEFKSFEISINGSKIDFSIIEWADLLETYDFNASEWLWLGSNRFALFSLEMPPNSTLVVGVEADITFHSNANRFTFAYCIGSARSWDGNTHQVIQMDFRDNANLVKHGFQPENYENIEVENETETIRWDFLITELDDNYVTFWGSHYETTSIEQGPFSNPLHAVLAVFFTIVLPLVIFSVYCIKTKDQTSKV